MLEEVLAAKPLDGELRQRWFTSQDFDLTVWFDADSRLHGFQLSYGKRAAPYESALTWRADAGFNLSEVNERRWSTPILRPGGSPLTPDILLAFRQQAGRLEPELKAEIVPRLRNYLRQRALQPDPPVARSRSAR